MHRWEYITTNQAMGLLAVGFVILIFSILFAVHAIVQLWNDGAKGGQAMILGLFLSILMLAPFVTYAVYAMQFPALNDVSTNIDTPPRYSEKTRIMRDARNVPDTNNIVDDYGDEETTAILLAYPKISPRRYPAGPERVLEAVRDIIEDRGWKITDIRGAPLTSHEKVEKEEENTPLKPAEKEKAEENNGLPSAHVEDILIDAVTSSMIFAFRNDVVIKIVSEEENTLVEMRSASRWGEHDFGSNAYTIENFMADLDRNLLGIAGEG